MAKKARLPINPAPVQQRPAWIGFAVTGLIAAACGAAISASILPKAAPPKAAPVAAIAPVAPTPPAAPAAETNAPAQTAAGMPPPQLVMDLPPAKIALNMGNWSYDQKNWQIAIAYYQEAIQRGLNSPDVLTDLGNAYRFSGQPQKALNQYFLAQKKNPAHETSLYNQGDVYASDLGDAKKGVAIWKEYLTKFPNGVHHEQAAHWIEITEAHSGANTSNAPAAPTQ
ncbi:MAG: Tetratricopeptide repeat protein [Capsulimonas sp.]|nr:Tetratricopeptide repeat protein [Capsulimonas sp.]